VVSRGGGGCGYLACLTICPSNQSWQLVFEAASMLQATWPVVGNEPSSQLYPGEPERWSHSAWIDAFGRASCSSFEPEQAGLALPHSISFQSWMAKFAAAVAVTVSAWVSALAQPPGFGKVLGSSPFAPAGQGQ